jgi:16S rRNA (guanine966-N2)-methyltransferase
MDRVKAAIFSSLGEKVTGARVLDLFAGAGGLGIEAMSRGAASVVFVESNRSAARAIERNLVITAVNGCVRMQGVFDFLQYATGHFDIIFADPPYEAAPGDKAYTDLLLNDLRIPALLALHGIFVLEKRLAERLPKHPHWKITRARRYGTTEVIFAEHQR